MNRSEDDRDRSGAHPTECSEPDCTRVASVELHIPWADNRLVCAPHARVLGRQDGIVADPIGDGDDLIGV